MLSFEEFLKERDKIDCNIKFYSAELKTFKRGDMGLVFDSEKQKPEYKTAKQGYDIWFKRLQMLNSKYVKVYKKELREHRKQTRGY